MMLLTLLACTTVVDFPPPMVWDSGRRSDSGTSTTGNPLFTPMAWEATCDESGWSYRLKVEGWVGGATLDYFLQDARPPQSSRSPLADVCDELAWYAGVALNGSVWRYAQQWNAEGPMHLILSTVTY